MFDKYLLIGKNKEKWQLFDTCKFVNIWSIILMNSDHLNQGQVWAWIKTPV